MQPHMQTSLVKDALLMARWRRRPTKGLIFNSDRGSQYCSHEFQATMKAWGIQSSMSRQGQLLGQRTHRALLGPSEGGLRAGSEVRHAGASQGCHPRLDGLLQPRSIALGTGVPQSYAVWATLAGCSAQERRMTTRAKRSEIQGQPQLPLSSRIGVQQ
jgi:Integrase core domain